MLSVANSIKAVYHLFERKIKNVQPIIYRPILGLISPVSPKASAYATDLLQSILEPLILLKPAQANLGAVHLNALLKAG
jgi:hypothetical protein